MMQSQLENEADLLAASTNDSTPSLKSPSTKDPLSKEPPKPRSKSARSRKKKSSFFADLYAKRSHELWGIALMLVSTLLLVAVFAYTTEDDATIENIALYEIFTETGRLAASHLKNPLGFFGAKLSSFLVKSVLGYPTALIVLLSGYWGWALFRRNSFEKASYATVYGVLFAVLTSSIFGLTHFTFSEAMSGAIGRFVASMLQTVVGTFGAWTALLALLGVTIVLFIDLDLQKTADRIAFLFRDKAYSAKAKFQEWYAVREEHRRRKRELVERLKDALTIEGDDTDAAPSLKTDASHVELTPATPLGSPTLTPDPLQQHAVAPDPPPIEKKTPIVKTSNDVPLVIKKTSDDSFGLADAMREEKLTHKITAPVTTPTAIDHPTSPATLNTALLTPESTRLDEPNSISHAVKGDSVGVSSDAPDMPPLYAATNWASALYEGNDTPTESSTRDAADIDDDLDDILKPFLKSEKPNDEIQAEPKVLLKEAVHEETADLDERDLTLETKAAAVYRFPSVDLLIEPEPDSDTVSIEELEENKRKLLEKLRIYKIDIVRVEATVGPRVTLFELELAPDVKISRIVTLQDDLAMAMSARGIRIIAPIPGKNAVGVEIPNSKSRMVRIKTMLNSEKFKHSKFQLPVAFGKTISNEIFIDDLAKMPHLLVAGATGSGKSVGINTILTSLIYFCSPEKVKFLLIDPKRVELFPYQLLKNHFLVKFQDLEEQIITDTSKAVYALKSVEKEMDIRYDRLAKAGVRNLQAFNEKFPDEALPFIVVVIDELADMMITAGRDVEEPIARLAQLARAVGIHLVVATQRPSVDVITGVIKANFPARIAYQVASKIDSRTILDSMGAEQLLGNGDMLYLPSSHPKPIRIQNAFVSTEEVEALTAFVYSQKDMNLAYPLPAPDMKALGKSDDDADEGGGLERDKMFEEAARLVVRHQQGSVSLLQRRLKLGFGRAARIMDQLEAHGIVGKQDASKPRDVLMGEESLELFLRDLE